MEVNCLLHGINSLNFTGCVEPAVFQRHLHEHTDLEYTDKKENPISTDTEIHALLSVFQNTVPS